MLQASGKPIEVGTAVTLGSMIAEALATLDDAHDREMLAAKGKRPTR